MQSLLFLLSALTSAHAAAVKGSAEGFAAGVTGGGNSAPVYPSTNQELVSYLGDSQPRVIVLNKEFNFIGSEGTASGRGCAPWGESPACQLAINQNGWCDAYQGDAANVTVSWDKAGISGITVKSNKSLVGQGSSAGLKGKGLRIANGAKNVIVQNIHVTDLNPDLVWGGDAITLDGTDMVWIDHVTTARIGRQHIVLGNSASGRVTITNHYVDGRSAKSASCDGHHYWALYFTGSNDLVTFKNNYIYHTSGRSPKVGGNTLLHAVNNYFYDNPNHAFELGTGGKVLAEGNVFQNVKTPIEANPTGRLFSSPNAGANNQCKQSIGHVCQVNGFGASGAFQGSDAGFLGDLKGKHVAGAAAYAAAKNVPNTAGAGKI